MTTLAQKPQSRARKGYSPNTKRTLLTWLILSPLIVIIFIPLLYIVTMSFTTETDQYLMPIKWIPQPITLLNFRKIFADPLVPMDALVRQ